MKRVAIAVLTLALLDVAACGNRDGRIIGFSSVVVDVQVMLVDRDTGRPISEAVVAIAPLPEMRLDAEWRKGAVASVEANDGDYFGARTDADGLAAIPYWVARCGSPPLVERAGILQLAGLAGSAPVVVAIKAGYEPASARLYSVEVRRSSEKDRDSFSMGVQIRLTKRR